jgi:hypothetical protein
MTLEVEVELFLRSFSTIFSSKVLTRITMGKHMLLIKVSHPNYRNNVAHEAARFLATARCIFKEKRDSISFPGLEKLEEGITVLRAAGFTIKSSD